MGRALFQLSPFVSGCPGLRSCRVEEDGPALHLPERVRPGETSQRFHVPTGVSAVQDCPRRTARAGQGQEPLAQRRRPQRSPAAGTQK